MKNPAAKASNYDLSSFSNKVLDTNPPVWNLAALQKNPEWLLTDVLALLVAGLAFFIVRSLPKVMNGGK